MTSKLSYISSWQFVFWDNERYLVSLQPKYMDALHVYVLKHSLTPCKSNSKVFIFIQFAMNIFHKAIIEPPIFLSVPTSFRIVISFRLVLLFSLKAFLVSSQWRNNNFHLSRIAEMRPQAMMELYLYLKNKERHILEGNSLKGSIRNVTWKANTATSVKRMVCIRK